MYSIILTFDGTDYVLKHSTGYDIATISGITGLDGKIETVQNNIGMGDIYTGHGTVNGIPITVQGFILDGNTEKKQQLCDILTPLRRGTLTLCNIDRSHRDDVPYRKIDFIVKKTPAISQEKHAKFSFTLFAPTPFWKDVSAVSIPGTTAYPVTVDVEGNVDADYSLMVAVSADAHLAEIGVFCDQGTTAQKHLYLDFRRLPTGYVTDDYVRVTWVDGKMSIALTSDGSSIIQTLNTQSTLFKLPHGTHTFSTYMRDENGNTIKPASFTAYWVIAYSPMYSGVVLSGI